MGITKNRILQFVIGLAFIALFCFLAYNLIQKQNKPYSFQSFIDEGHTASIIVNDIDRIGGKKLTAEDLGIENYKLGQGYDAIINAKSKSYNDLIGERIMMSYSPENFTLVLQRPNLTIDGVLDLIESELKLATAVNDTKITIEDGAYFYKFYNDFLVFSNTEISFTNGEFEPIRYGNADYVKIKEGQIERCLVTPQISYSSKSYKDSIKGKPVSYKDVFNLIPSDFDFAELYGSSRFSEDKTHFFKSDQGFSWCESYLGIIRKDSMEVLIAPIGLSRDLKLILEEETLMGMGDSSLIMVENVASYDVLQIETKEPWQEVLPELNKPVKYFAQIGNYNLISTSKEGMNWVLSSWQLGNVSYKNKQIAYVLDKFLPHSMNWLRIQKSQTGWDVSGKVNTKNKMLTADLIVNAGDTSIEGVQNVFELDLGFIPEKMLLAKGNEEHYIIAYGEKKIGVINMQGELLFTRVAGEEILEINVLKDKNSGNPTFVVLMKNSIDRFDINNKGFYGLPKKFNEQSYGGQVITYPDNNQLRFFIGIGKSVTCFQPGDGLSVVEGWVFPAMKAPLNQFIYRQVAGKDYLVIQNMLNEIMVVNRKGELRFPMKVSLMAERFDNRLMGSSENGLFIQGYDKGYLYRYFLANNVTDSTELDRKMNAENQGWIKNEAINEFWQESTNLFVRYDEFGFVKDEIIKPSLQASFGGYLTPTSKTTIFADNKNNKLYLLDERGALITENPLSGSSVWAGNEELLFTCSGSKLIAYELK